MMVILLVSTYMLNNSDGFYIHIDDVDDVFVAS